MAPLPHPPLKNAESRHFRMHIPMHSDITLCDARESPSARQPSLAIVMSVRCARRRDLPAVIACKHPCGGNTTEDVVSSLFYLFSRSRARRHDELIHPPSRHGGHQDDGVSSRADVDGGRNFLAFYTDVHGCTPRLSALGCKNPCN